MGTVAKKIIMGSGAVAEPSDDEFNRTSFLSHFEGSNNGVNNVFDDASASNHTITAAGDVTQGSFGPFARPDGEWAFNNTASTNDSFKVTAHDNFDMTNPFTIEGWIFLSDLTANKLLFGRENNYWVTHDYQAIGGASGKFGFNYQNSGSWGAINASAATVANTWYFLQATYVGTTVTFYINGASQGTASVGSPSSNTDKPFYVLSGPGQKHTGTASNVRLSSVARSTSLPTAKFTSDSDTELLVCQSNRFVDNGPDGHTITTTAGTSVSAFGPFLTSSVYSAAVNGASAYFDGNGDYLSAEDDANFSFGTGDFTVECWLFHQNASATFYDIMGTANNSAYVGSNRGGWILAYYHTYGSGRYAVQFGYQYNNSFPVDVAFSKTLNADGWYHLTISRQGNQLKCFVNGIQAGSTVTNSTDMISTEPLTVGTGSGASNSGPMTGYICDARVVKGTAVYTGNFTPPTAPLTAITNTKLLLNMADGQAIDSAAQNNLTLYGTAKTSTAQKKFGTASLLLDGNSDYAEMRYSSLFEIGAGAYTVECFIKTSGVTGEIVGAFNTASPYKGWLFGVGFGSGDGKLKVYNANASNAETVSSTAVVNNNAWRHVAFSKAGQTLKFFIDGNLDSTHTLQYVGVGSEQTIVIGASSNPTRDRFFNGYIDELRVTKATRYTADFTAPTKAFPDKGQ